MKYKGYPAVPALVIQMRIELFMMSTIRNAWVTMMNRLSYYEIQSCARVESKGQNVICVVI